MRTIDVMEGIQWVLNETVRKRVLNNDYFTCRIEYMMWCYYPTGLNYTQNLIQRPGAGQSSSRNKVLKNFEFWMLSNGL